MKHLLLSELYRLKKNKGIFVTFILAIVFSFISPLFITVGLALLETMINVESLDFYGINQFCSILAGGSLISIIMFFTISSYSNDDFKFRTVQNKIISGYSRKKIFFAKLIINVSASVVILVIYALLSLLFSSLFLGFNKESTFTMTSLTNILLLLLCAILIQITTYTLLTTINVIAQKNTKTLIWFVLINIFISIISSTLIDILNELELYSWVNLIQDMLPEMQLMYIGLNLLNIDLIILIVVTNLIYTLIITLIGYSSFKTKELK